MKHPTHGFTLFEVLISLTIFLVIIATLFGSVRITMSTERETGKQASLQLDSQAANLLLGNRLREAIYVYPAGSVVNLPNKSHMKNHLQNPAGTTTWIPGTGTGQDRGFLAFIQAPKTPQGTCNTTTPGGCYTFIAYYPVPRAKLVSSPDMNPLAQPENTPSNQNQWVLMEYQSPITAGSITVDSTFKVTSLPSSSAFAAGEARMLLDLIQPGTLQFIVDPVNLDVTLSYQLQNLTPPTTLYPTSGNTTLVISPRNWQ